MAGIELGVSVRQGTAPRPVAPEPDLFIRTGGEQRISNFLLWQLAYSELYVTDIPWPEFREQALHDAITEYGRRRRRFGKTDEQIGADPC